jgi:hypothetical protein
VAGIACAVKYDKDPVKDLGWKSLTMLATCAGAMRCSVRHAFQSQCTMGCMPKSSTGIIQAIILVTKGLKAELIHQPLNRPDSRELSKKKDKKKVEAGSAC